MVIVYRNDGTLKVDPFKNFTARWSMESLLYHDEFFEFVKAFGSYAYYDLEWPAGDELIKLVFSFLKFQEGREIWYRVLRPTIVREGVSFRSERLKVLKIGQRVNVVGLQEARVKITVPVEGWCSLATSDGMRILKPIESLIPEEKKEVELSFVLGQYRIEYRGDEVVQVWGEARRLGVKPGWRIVQISFGETTLTLDRDVDVGSITHSSSIVFEGKRKEVEAARHKQEVTWKQQANLADKIWKEVYEAHAGAAAAKQPALQNQEAHLDHWILVARRNMEKNKGMSLRKMECSQRPLDVQPCPVKTAAKRLKTLVQDVVEKITVLFSPPESVSEAYQLGIRTQWHDLRVMEVDRNSPAQLERICEGCKWLSINGEKPGFLMLLKLMQAREPIRAVFSKPMQSHGSKIDLNKQDPSKSFRFVE